MAAKTIYCQIEDDLRKVTKALEDAEVNEVVLVFPKRSYIFGDSLNLRLLKKHADILGKTVSVMTADERGQVYARDAGFNLRPHTAGVNRANRNTDIRAGFKESVVPAPKQPAVTAHVPKPAVKKVPTASAESKSAPAKLKAVPARPVLMEVPKVSVQDTVFPDVSGVTELLTNRRKQVHGRSLALSWVFASLLVGVVAGSAVAFPSMAIVVTPKSESLERTFEVSLRQEAVPDNSQQLALQSQVIDRNLEAGGRFAVEGKSEMGSKARGKVKIVNISGLPLTLKAATTTLSANGKKYKLSADQVLIPAVTSQQAADTNSGTEVEVVAEEGGQASNLAIGTRLEIANQVFGSRPAVLFARSSSEITGGNSRFVSIVTEQDAEKAKDSLTKKVLTDLQKEFEKKGIDVPTSAARVEVTDFKTDQVVGAEVSSMNATLKARVVTIGFPSDKLLTLLRQRMEKNVSMGKKLQEKNLDSLEYNMQGLPDEKGNGKLLVLYKSRMIFEMTQNEAVSALGSGKVAVAVDKVRGNEKVQDISYKMSPSWWPYVPFLTRRVSIEFK